MPFRFAFDLGTTSIGWAVYELDPVTWKEQKRGKPVGLRRLGVRIFDDGRNPQSGKSHAANRRLPRTMRRQQDRRLARRKRLEQDLADCGLLPDRGADRDALFSCVDRNGKSSHPGQSCPQSPDADCRNPYRLRARAAAGEVTLHELGRVLWHISRHRGFKSNRKADQGEDDSGLIRSAGKALEARLKSGGHPTYGAYLWSRLQAGEGVRVRPQGDGAEKHYEFYPTRDMLEAEFDCIWAEQTKHHPRLTDEDRDRLRGTIFFQRDLRPVDPGRCTFFPERPRLPRWHPDAQAFLILQQLGHLRIIRETRESRLDPDRHAVLFDALYGGRKMTWSNVRNTLGLTSQDELNLANGGLKHLHFNEVAAALVGTTRKPGPLAARWPEYDTATREEVLKQLAQTESPDALIRWLAGELGLDAGTAAAVERTQLPDGHLRFCREAVEALVTEMRSDVITYSEAVEQAPLLAAADIRHSDARPDSGVDNLPPYNELPVLQRMLGTGTGNPEDPHDVRLGRIANPTVHIGLNQFRRIINMLTAEYGKPDEIVLEAARDLSRSPRERAEVEKRIKANEKRNDGYRKRLEEEDVIGPGQRVGELFLKMRLWEELGRNEADRRSPFTGRPISLADLHSEVEIEHILPFGDTLDDSPANKTLAFREENRRKGKLSPGEAAARGIFDQQTIIDLTKHLPRNKAWRFLPDAMEVYEEQKSFEARQLHATGYLARVVRAYAEALFDKRDPDGVNRTHVWMLPGRMTALLRHRWGLNLGDHNRKDRNDHRHHAIDAAVVGVIDRRMIAGLQRAARAHGAMMLERVLPDPPDPFPGFRDAVHAAAREVRVSHRPRHLTASADGPSRTSGRLHEATAYGLVRDVPENQADRTIGNVVVRKQATALSRKEIGQVRDVKLRRDLLEATEPARAAGLKESEAEKLRAELLADWSRKTGHRRLRILKAENPVRAVHDCAGRAYKYFAPGEVACVDIIDVDGVWKAHPLSVWDANSGQGRAWNDAYPSGRFVMRVHKNDTLQLFDWDDEEEEVVPGSNSIKRVVRLEPSNKRLRLCDLKEAGTLQKRHKDEDDDFRWDLASISKLKLRRARRVRIDELGRVRIIPHGMA